MSRLGFLGLVVALTAPAGYFTEYYFQPARVVSAAGLPLAAIAAASIAVTGVVVCLLCWTRKVNAERMLDIGLLFEMFVAFAIAILEFATPIPAGTLVRGVSWNCLWISIFVVAVPGTFFKTAAAAAGSAVMAPAGALAASAINSHPLPPAGQMLLLLLPVFAAAGWAIPVARYLNRMTALVIKARELGSYDLIPLIGRGGMGEVWEAQHRLLRRRSAIKLIRTDSLLGETSGSIETRVRRFEREARTIASLRSTHTVALYDFGVSDDGRFYYVMELLEGIDLEVLVRRFGPQPASRVVEILRQMLKSLGEAHEHGLVHRDVKPRNVFLCRQGSDYDFVKVLDFGLVKYDARRFDTETALTREGVTTGTPAFMAPEVSLGSPGVDARADIYGVGCVAYWLLTGQLVFDRPNAMAMAIAHLHETPEAPSRHSEVAIPAALDRLVLECLEKDPGRRPQSAAELERQLAACKLGDPWTPEQAEDWWNSHLPSGGAACVPVAAGTE